jgi:hypothetical protein
LTGTGESDGVKLFQEKGKRFRRQLFSIFRFFLFLEIYRAMDNEKSPEVETALTAINELEKDIALADYELRTSLDPYTLRLLKRTLTIQSVKEQAKRYQKLHAKRDEIVSKIPNFWLKVVSVTYQKVDTDL